MKALLLITTVLLAIGCGFGTGPQAEKTYEEKLQGKWVSNQVEQCWHHRHDNSCGGIIGYRWLEFDISGNHFDWKSRAEGTIWSVSHLGDTINSGPYSEEFVANGWMEHQYRMDTLTVLTIDNEFTGTHREHSYDAKLDGDTLRVTYQHHNSDIPVLYKFTKKGN